MLPLSLSLLAPALLALQAEPADIPFELKLPNGFSAFERVGGTGKEWIAQDKTGDARISIAHIALADAGARGDSIAKDLRQRKWAPLLQSYEHQIVPWSGTWAEGKAFGNQISFTQNGRERAAVEYILLELDSLILASWEGPAESYGEAVNCLMKFHPPLRWRPTPPVDLDTSKGLGPKAEVVPSIGFFDCYVEIVNGAKDKIEVTISFTASNSLRASLTDKNALDWQLPTGLTQTVALIDGHCEFTYELPALSTAEGSSIPDGPVFGIWHSHLSAAFLDPVWLAMPVLDQPTRTPRAFFESPAWRLKVRARGADRVLSSLAAESLELDAETATRVYQFPTNPAGNGWPFFLVGSFHPNKELHYPLWLRAGARAHKAKEYLEFLTKLEHALRDWLPAHQVNWQIASFPNCGNRMLPGLLLFDESEDWLQAPLDGHYKNTNRQVALAELIGARLFGLKLKGVGSATAFLESSLAEFAALRLLQSADEFDLADNLHRSWLERETIAGPLAQPLSLIDNSDLQGPQRLLSRGPLTWLAIQQLAGQSQLDAVLNQMLREQRHWTTEVLRQALETRTNTSWEEFFRRYIYGRETPPTISKL